MMVGHAFLAFAIAGLGAYLLGIEKEKALILGIFAGLFAFVPDIDMIYAWKEIFTVFQSGLLGFSDSFWAASTVIHRGLTHSLTTGLIGTAAFMAYYRHRKLSVLILGTVLLALYGLIFESWLAARVLTLYSLAGLAITEGAIRYDKLSVKKIGAASLIGLTSHPFGDLFTGTPPKFLAPTDITLFQDTLVLNADPTLNFLGVFIIELGAIWAGLITAFYLMDRKIGSSLYRGRLLGIVFSIAAFFIEPSLSESYRFVFSILGLASLSAAIIFFADEEISLNRRGQLELVLNFFATTTIGITAYLTVFLLLGL